jgi:hypothetical protein
MTGMTDVYDGLKNPASFAAPVPRRVRRPSWLDFRLVAGIALVLLAVLGGSVALGSSDHRQGFWTVSHDLSAGTTVRATDLHPVRVQLGTAAARYLESDEPVVGKVVLRDVRAGQLLARGDLVAPPAGVVVTAPIRSENAPPVAHGDRITLWVSTKSCKASVVVSGVPVQEVRPTGSSAFGSASGLAVVLNLPASDADRVISALDGDSAVLRIGVLQSGQAAAAPSADLSECLAPRK